MDALGYVAPVGEETSFVAHALEVVTKNQHQLAQMTNSPVYR